MTDASLDLAIVVDPGLDEPVYAQIAHQILEAIASGVVPAGALLPGVRVLASDLGVNLNTVARAYRLLEDDGFVAIESRSGVRVVPPGTQGSPEMRARLQGELREVLVRMRQAGFAPRQLRRLALHQIASLVAPHRT
jgi:GntR family transcriptional regulator